MESTQIITVEDGGFNRSDVQISHEVRQPSDFSSCYCHSMIFRLRTREREMAGCFLADQDTQLLPTKVWYPVVDR